MTEFGTTGRFALRNINNTIEILITSTIKVQPRYIFNFPKEESNNAE